MRGGEKHQYVVASRAPPTGDLAHNPGMCPDWGLNHWPFSSQTGAHSTEPHQPGLKVLNVFEPGAPWSPCALSPTHYAAGPAWRTWLGTTGPEAGPGKPDGAPEALVSVCLCLFVSAPLTPTLPVLFSPLLRQHTCQPRPRFHLLCSRVRPHGNSVGQGHWLPGLDRPPALLQSALARGTESSVPTRLPHRSRKQSQQLAKNKSALKLPVKHIQQPPGRRRGECSA